MSKKRQRSLIDNDVPNLIKEHQDKMTNGLSDALGFSGGSFAFPQNQAWPGTQQISRINTVFENLRFYLVSNMRQILSQAYVEIGLIQTIVDVPVDDALRGGVKIKSKQLDEEQIQELMRDQERSDDLNTIGQTAKWNRLFGGAGTLILVGDQDPAEELDLDAIGEDTPLDLRAADMWELSYGIQNVDDEDENEGEGVAIGDPNAADFGCFNYYGHQLHKSRVVVMRGQLAPSFVRPRLRGWGVSVVEILVRSINQYIKATNLGFEVLDEFKLDIYKIKNLVNTLLAPNGKQKIQERIQLANWQKNYQNAMVMDSEDDYDHKQLSFAGLAEAMDGIRMQVASDMRIPRSKLFGEAGGGLDSGKNEGDLEVYNSMVESTIRSKIKYDIIRVLEIKCQKLFGFVPDDLDIEFKPLRVLSGLDEETVKTQKFDRALKARQAGEITTYEFRENCNKGGLLDVVLDVSGDQLNPDDPEIDELTDEGSDGLKQQRVEETAEMTAEMSAKTDKPKPGKKENARVFVMPKPYTFGERVKRLTNAAYLDTRAYEQAGKDTWIPDALFARIMKQSKDQALWVRARAAARDATRHSFNPSKQPDKAVAFFYKKLGGKFE